MPGCKSISTVGTQLMTVTGAPRNTPWKNAIAAEVPQKGSAQDPQRNEPSLAMRKKQFVLLQASLFLIHITVFYPWFTL